MDETNEDSWLYGTSNPDSTTNETQDEANVAGNAENRVAPSHKTDAENATSDMLVETKEEPITHDEYEDPAQEMEEDEEATAVTAADTTDTDGGGNACVEGDDNQDSGDGQTKQQQKSAVGSDDDDDDSDDDDINVVIGDIKAAPSSYNIKQRGNLMATGQGGQDKPKGTSQGGKFSMEDFEGVGTINGVAAHEFSIDSLEDKPWRKPGADITDYFNYGFNEETWRAYCERQKRFRVSESGVGLASLTQNLNQSERHGNEHGGLGLLPPPGSMLPPNAMMHDSMQGVPPGGMMPPPIGVHHHGAPMQRLPMRPRQLSTLGNAGNTSKENAIQVMTAECREYSRPGQMASNFSGPTPSEEPFFAEPETFDYGYEPTQESQWGNNDNSGWVPTGIKELTPGPALVAPPMAGPPSGPPPGAMPPGPPMAGPPPTIRGPPPMMGNMPPNMGMGPPPHVMMMGPMNLPPMGPRMIPPQMGGPGGPPTMAPNQNRPDDRMRSPSRRNRSRSPQRSRRRSKTPTSQRQRRSRSRSKSRKPRSRSRSKSRKPRSTRRSLSKSRRSLSKSRRSTSKSRRSPSKSRNSRKSTRTQRSPSQSKSRSKRHSRTRSKSPKASSSSNPAKKRTEKTEK